jgi:hypothetical protein
MMITVNTASAQVQDNYFIFQELLDKDDVVAQLQSRVDSFSKLHSRGASALDGSFIADKLVPIIIYLYYKMYAIFIFLFILHWFYLSRGRIDCNHHGSWI